MMYHLYDNNRQHLAISESLEDLRSAALQAFQQDGLPFAYIRWRDVTGQQQEVRVTSQSLAAAAPAPVPSSPQVHAPRSKPPQRSARQRANLLTGTAIFFFLLYLASEITSMVLR